MTDEEWQVKVRGWVGRMRADTMKLTQYLYPDLMKVFREMEEAAGQSA